MALLTTKERLILERLAAGRTKKAIAKELKVSVPAVENSCRDAMRKMRAASMAELIRLLLEAGLKLGAVALLIMSSGARIGG